MTQNFDLKEQIREYWSGRAAEFDLSFSHSITHGFELDAWCAMYRGMLGPEPKKVLELGSGTGEVSKVLLTLGHTVTGLDFSDTMLALAKAKHADKGEKATYFAADAEATGQPDSTYDAVTCRHLVWTLLAPQQALTDWFRVLKPGGHLVIFDGNFTHKSLKDRMIRKLITLIDSSKPRPGKSIGCQATHQEITSQLPFSKGFAFSDLERLAADAGFQDITRLSYSPVRKAQRKVAGPADWLTTFTTDRYVLHARKPD